jgi:hypothetical protein
MRGRKSVGLSLKMTCQELKAAIVVGNALDALPKTFEKEGYK